MQGQDEYGDKHPEYVKKGEQIKQTRPEGLGGCRSEEECEAYCRECEAYCRAHPDECKKWCMQHPELCKMKVDKDFEVEIKTETESKYGSKPVKFAMAVNLSEIDCENGVGIGPWGCIEEITLKI